MEDEDDDEDEEVWKTSKWCIRIQIFISILLLYVKSHIYLSSPLRNKLTFIRVVWPEMLRDKKWGGKQGKYDYKSNKFINYWINDLCQNE